MGFVHIVWEHLVLQALKYLALGRVRKIRSRNSITPSIPVLGIF